MVKMPHWPIPIGIKPVDENLSALQTLLNRLGNPHHKLPPVIHVAGTNGKGSSLAFLKSILKEGGYQVHRYTSPHLLRFNERIEIAGEPISDRLLYQVAEECRLQSRDLQLTFFEGITAMALLVFSRFFADVILLETGMGGRLDATRIAQNIILTLITTVSLDHMEYLGDNVFSIAKEKAGIIKNHTPCVISRQYTEALEALEESCTQLSAPSFICGKDWNFEMHDNGFAFVDNENIMELPLPSLIGKHQIINASNAIAVLRCLPEFQVSYNNIINGITHTHWPARLQKITTGVLSSMLPEAWELWLDGAHNDAGAAMLAVTIQEWKKPIFLVHGRTQGKDTASFLQSFLGLIEEVQCVKVQWEPKAENPARIHNIAQKLGLKSQGAEDIKEAITNCIKSGADEGIVLICGSLYLAGDVLEANKL